MLRTAERPTRRRNSRIRAVIVFPVVLVGAAISVVPTCGQRGPRAASPRRGPAAERQGRWADSQQSWRLQQHAGGPSLSEDETLGLTQFGVNLVTLEPGSMSSLRHWHEVEDEFVYVLEGELVLVDDNGEHLMAAGMFAGFPANCENGHHLQNRSQARATMMVVGSRRHGEDVVHYPDDDLGPIRR